MGFLLELEEQGPQGEG